MTRLCFLLAALPLAAAEPAAAWWKHVEFLASDRLEGRAAGSPGHRAAAEYVSAQYRAAGLQPCGTNGFFQPVDFIERSLDEPQSSLVLTWADGRVERVALGQDATIALRTSTGEAVEGEAVFVGHGLRIPSEKHDDLAGLDLRGKFAVYLSGAPGRIPGPLRAHFSSAAQRARVFREAGVAGVIAFSNPKNSDIPWDRGLKSRLIPQMLLADPALQDGGGPAFGAASSPALTARLFEGTGHTAEEILALDSEGKALPRFPLRFRASGKPSISTRRVQSDNVCGILPGAAKKSETVVITAHLDHIGIGQPINGDSLNNGAMDNASGIATLIEVARALAAGSKPARSVAFVAVTAEEKGLLGSRYFAARPPKAVGRMVANLNFDMFLPIHAMKSVVAFGLEESTLRQPLEKVAAKMGLKVLPDPEPARNRFVRSDQYSFIRLGIPAMAFKVGFDPGTPEAEIQKEWTRTRYHAPSDDLSQPVDLSAAQTFNQMVEQIAREVANAPAAPTWLPGSFFARQSR